MDTLYVRVLLYTHIFKTVYIITYINTDLFDAQYPPCMYMFICHSVYA